MDYVLKFSVGGFTWNYPPSLGWDKNFKIHFHQKNYVTRMSSPIKLRNKQN